MSLPTASQNNKEGLLHIADRILFCPQEPHSERTRHESIAIINFLDKILGMTCVVVLALQTWEGILSQQRLTGLVLASLSLLILNFSVSYFSVRVNNFKIPEFCRLIGSIITLTLVSYYSYGVWQDTWHLHMIMILGMAINGTMTVRVRFAVLFFCTCMPYALVHFFIHEGTTSVQPILLASHLALMTMGGLLGQQITDRLMKYIFIMDAQNEQLAAQRDLAEDANRAKSAFIANMSHELRTPMNTILGYSQMIKEKSPIAEQPVFLEALEEIEESGNHLLTLINQVLDISKIEQDIVEVTVEPFDLGPALKSAIAIALPLAKKKHNSLTYHVFSEKITANQDFQKLRQIVLNLIANATKFCENGSIMVNAEIFYSEGDPWLKCAITDTGIGISPEQQDKIFEKFVQVDTSPTRRYQGSGLGLTICKNFVEAMGGRIFVTSALGAGATFTLEIPVHLQAPTTKAAS